jgi:hypothetical protein
MGTNNNGHPKDKQIKRLQRLAGQRLNQNIKAAKSAAKARKP